VSTNVKIIGGNTVAVSTGESNYLWNDKNKNGVVDKGDLVVRTRQEDQSVMAYVVGADEGTYAWGDPHLDNIAFTKEGKEALTKALNVAFADAKDGNLDNSSLLGHIDLAVGLHGKRENIMDFHSNIAIALTDRTRLEFNVVVDKNYSDKVAFTNNVDLVVDGRTITFDDLYVSKDETKGKSSVTDTTADKRAQAVADSSSLKTFHEWNGSNVVQGSTMFGKAAGTADYAHVVDVDGKINLAYGKQSYEAMSFTDALRVGNYPLAYALQMSFSDDEVEDAKKKFTQEQRMGALGKNNSEI
jgi:hypothetical protein